MSASSLETKAFRHYKQLRLAHSAVDEAMKGGKALVLCATQAGYQSSKQMIDQAFDLIDATPEQRARVTYHVNETP